MEHPLRDYQLACVDAIVQHDREQRDGRADRKPILADLFCGTGKSRIMGELVHVHFHDGIQFIVMSTLSLVRQFCAIYLGLARYMVFCSLEDTDGVNEATTDVAEAVKFFAGGSGIVATTYHSLEKLVGCLGEGQVVSTVFFDESHNLQRPGNEWALECPKFERRLLFSATPSKNNGDPVFSFSYAEALEHEDEWGLPQPFSQDVSLHVGTFDGSAGAVAPHDNIELLIKTALKTENMRCLSFHGTVNGEDPDSVKNFAQRCKDQLPILAPGIKWRVETLDATTSPRDRVRILEEFDATPDDELFILCSCETISEGVDTKRCNLVAFITPVRSYYKIVQKFGRAVRLQSHDRPATILLPFWVDPAQFTYTSTKEERDAIVRTIYSKGNPLFDFYAAVREGDPELLELFQNMYRGPQTKRLKHYAELCGDRPRLSWEEAVQEATGLDTDDIATAARESNTTVEVHPRDGPVEQHEGAAAVEKTIVEMEKDCFVVVPKVVAPAPRENRVVYDSCSPVLMNVNFNEELGTAVLEYEMRPEHFEQRIQELKDFYAEHGEPRREGKRDNESTIASWIGGFRQKKRLGLLDVETVRRIEYEFPWWSWNPFLEAFDAKLKLLKLFYDKHTEAPKRKGIHENEQPLSDWCHNVRERKRKGILAQNLIDRINIDFPWFSWNPRDDEFHEKLGKLVIFYKTFQEEPLQRGSRNNERLLGLWIQFIRKRKRAGLLSSIRFELIERQCPWFKWEPTIDVIENNFRMMHEFYSSFKEIPKKKGSRKNEAFLWKWLTHYREHYRKGKLCAEIIDRINREFPWWVWSIFSTEMEVKITKLHAFYERYNDEPKAKGDRIDETILANWIQNRRMKFKNGKLTSSIIAHIEREFPNWDWGKKRKKYKTSYSSMDEGTASAITEDGAESSLDSMEFAPSAEPEHQEERREKRSRDDGLDGMDKDALIAMIREQKRGREGGGYTAPNPVNKDEINALFSRLLPRHRGAVLFLDHTDFKTARALQAAGVDPRDMIIPQRDRATYDIMRCDPVFGACVAFSDFNDILSQHTMPVRGIYADFTGSFSVAEGFVEACRDIQFLPQAVVAVTISLRNPDGTDHLYQDVGRLIGLLNLHLDTVVITDVETGKTVPSMVYGNGAPMATVVQRRRN